MYNETKKKQYIEVSKEKQVAGKVKRSKNQTKEKRANKKEYVQNITAWFDKAEPCEERLKKDLAEFTATDILQFYKDDIKTSSMPYLVRLHGAYRDYAEWANPDQHFSEINGNLLGMCINTDKTRSKIVLREELLDGIGEFKNAMEKVIVLALYEGMDLTDFDNLTMSDVDVNKRIAYVKIKDKKTKTVTGTKEVKISEELIRYMKQAAETYELDKKSEKAIHCQLDATDERIIKQLQRFPDTDRMLRYRRIIVRAKDRYGFEWINAAELPQSGAANMLYEFVKAEKNMNIDEVGKKHLDEIRQQYGQYWTCGQKFKNKYGYLFE